MDSKSLGVKIITKKDYPEILECDYKLDIKELHELCRKGFGYICRVKDEFFGYFIYTCEEDKIFIDRLFVNEEYRRKNIGTKIINRLKNKLNDKYKTLEIIVSQDDFESCFFLKDAGFMGEILDSDNYLFKYGS